MNYKNPDFMQSLILSIKDYLIGTFFPEERRDIHKTNKFKNTYKDYKNFSNLACLRRS